MQFTRIIIDGYNQFGLLDLDLTYREGHDKVGQPLEKVCLGSCLEGVDAGLVVIDDEEFSDQMVILKFSGERKTLAHIAGDTGSQGGIPSFDVIGFTAFLAHLLVVALTEQDAVGLPMIAVRGTAQVLQWDLAQQSTKGGFTAISNYVGHDLSSAPAKRSPEPLLVFLAATEAAYLVKLQH